MPKMKTHKGARKRFRVTATGKVRYKRSFAGHLMSGKTGNHKRKLRKPGILSGTAAKRISALTGGG